MNRKLRNQEIENSQRNKEISKIFRTKSRVSSRISLSPYSTLNNSEAKREATKRIREDQKYIQEKKFKIQEEKDSRRREAVKRIHGQLANQEGEVKKVKHKKYNLFPDL